jgi:hypothetical protein
MRSMRPLFWGEINVDHHVTHSKWQVMDEISHQFPPPPPWRLSVYVVCNQKASGPRSHDFPSPCGNGNLGIWGFGDLVEPHVIF